MVGGHVDLITQEGRLVQHRLQVVEGRLEELSDTFTGEPEGVEKLIVGVRHSAIHQRSIVVCLDHAEGGVVLALVHGIQPTLAFLRERHILGHELKVFDAALGNHQLDILNLSCRGKACELADLGDIVIEEPIL